MHQEPELTTRQKNVLRLLAPLFSAFDYVKYGAPRERETNLRNKLRVFAIALEDIDAPELSAGILKCIRTKTFPPTIAEIREECESLRCAIAGDGAKSIDEAWGEVLRQMHDAHYNRPPQFSTAEVAEAARKMGWRALCAAEESEMIGNRAQFIKIYESILRRKRNARENQGVINILGQENLQGLIGKTSAKMVVQ